MVLKKVILLFICCCLSLQAQKFTRRDSLQGGLRKERICFDVQRYDLSIAVQPDKKFISGYNDISFITVQETDQLQIDLFENMSIDSIVMDHQKLDYFRDQAAVFVKVNKLPKDIYKSIRFYYSGNPQIGENAPWDGGFVFSYDQLGLPWIGVAVQGTGASLWYPVKDTQTDEPDKGASIKITVPDNLVAISNGRFLDAQRINKNFTQYTWEVKNPINNYDITLYIGNYTLLRDTHRGVDLDYYVLKGNEEKAKQHFVDVKPMLDCFELKFGEYPFKNDGFKLVEAPYLGMEHQSAIAYGNEFKKGYLGSDMSGTGIAQRFDYIIIHEAGHEWFGNSITSADIADMWIHEGFTTYSESVFVECLYGYDDALEYINGQKYLITNDTPLIGNYGVNHQGSNDMYYKGAWLIHTMRHIVNDDQKWWQVLKSFTETFKHKIITTQDVLSFFNRATNFNFDLIFKQYLQSTQIPELVFEKKANGYRYTFKNVVSGFKMPVDVMIQGKLYRLIADDNWQNLEILASDAKDIEVLTKHFLINVKK